jgi:hypothetical protein
MRRYKKTVQSSAVGGQYSTRSIFNVSVSSEIRKNYICKAVEK